MREPGLLKPAVLWLLLLAPLFFSTYGFATWVTSQRSDVGTQRGREVGLLVQVDDEGAMALGEEPAGMGDQGGLAHPALLVHDGQGLHG